jgi:hypothetical protein
MARIAIQISAPKGARLLASASEREAALMAESVINGIALAALPVPVWIHCANAGIRRRLTGYLAGVQGELASGCPTSNTFPAALSFKGC